VRLHRPACVRSDGASLESRNGAGARPRSSRGRNGGHIEVGNLEGRCTEPYRSFETLPSVVTVSMLLRACNDFPTGSHGGFLFGGMKDMICPECNSGETDTEGTCPSCGYKVSTVEPAADSSFDEARQFEGLIEMDVSSPSKPDSEPEADLPEWRRQLSRRLQEIKQKREGGEGEDQPISSESRNAAPKPAPIPPAPQIARAPAQNSRPPSATPRKPPAPPGRQPVPGRIQSREKPPERTLFDLPIREKFESKPVQTKMEGRSGNAAEQETRNLIDSAVVRPGRIPGSRAPAGDLEETQAPFYSDKLILLSRTLSGLVDLIIIFLCTGAFILCADLFSGIDYIDTVSLIDYLALLLAIHFVYSVFFLRASSQTIGMMITDLRVAAKDGRRPGIVQILTRCSTFLLSVVTVGVGLLWGIFDRETRCLHDLVSDTQVLRIE
jgi:uncharacterized RDD family membrane protein YckC